jgi:hypothetical protein
MTEREKLVAENATTSERARESLALDAAAKINYIWCLNTHANHMSDMRKIIKDAIVAAAAPAQNSADDVLRIRCMNHRDVPQYNGNAAGGAECPACEIEPRSERWKKDKPFDYLPTMDEACRFMQSNPLTSADMLKEILAAKPANAAPEAQK